MVVTDDRIVGKSLIALRQILASGCTDPISGTRSNFIVLKGSRRPKEFPVVMLDIMSTRGRPLGIQSEAMEFTVTAKADVQSTTVGYDAKGCDWVFDDVVNTLRTNQRGTSPISGTQSHGLYDLRILNSFAIDEPGPEGLHRRIATFSYNYHTDVD